MRLNISMGDIKRSQIVQAPEQLIGVYLDQDWMDTGEVHLVLLVQTVSCLVEVLHYNVQVLLPLLLCVEVVLDLQDVGMVEHL